MNTNKKFPLKKPKLTNKLWDKYKDVDIDKELEDVKNGKGSKVLGVNQEGYEHFDPTWPKSTVKPHGKLKRLHFIGSELKRWIDKNGDMFSYLPKFGFVHEGNVVFV